MTAEAVYNLLFSGGNYSKPYLVRFSHPTAGVLRFVNNNEAVEYENAVYAPANFKYTQPDSKGEGGSLEIGIADNAAIVEWVENADDRYSLEVVGVLIGDEVQPIRSFRHFYGTVSMGADNTLSFSLENDGRLGMIFNVYKYDTDLNPGNA